MYRWWMRIKGVEEREIVEEDEDADKGEDTEVGVDEVIVVVRLLRREGRSGSLCTYTTSARDQPRGASLIALDR